MWSRSERASAVVSRARGNEELPDLGCDCCQTKTFCNHSPEIRGTLTMPHTRIATAISLLVALPSCSFIIDTNPDGVITTTNASGARGKADTSGKGEATAGGAGGLRSSGGAGGTTPAAGSGGIANTAGSASSGGGIALGGRSTFGGAATTPGGDTGIAGSATASGAGLGGGASGAVAGAIGTSGGANNSSGGTQTTVGGTSSAGTSTTGGNASTGGSTGVAGTFATGGVAGCGDTQSSADNCGTCGHSCLGGECVLGMCQPVVVVTNPLTTQGFDVRFMDETNVYYRQEAEDGSPNFTIYRVGKDSVSGTGASIMSYTCGEVIARAGTSIFYNTYPCSMHAPMTTPITMYSCSADDGSAPASAAKTARVVPSEVRTDYLATIDLACDATVCVNWWSDSGASISTYRDTGWMPADLPSALRGSFDSLAFGTGVYWVQELFGSNQISIGMSLLYVDRTTLNRAQLAGQIPSRVSMLSVNATSVLFDYTDTHDLYRVPLPLGLGNNPPQPVGIVARDAVEDSQWLYSVDQVGSVSRCSPQNCAATQQVIAIGQPSAYRLLMDDKALYWGRSNPDSVMRLAK